MGRQERQNHKLVVFPLAGDVPSQGEPKEVLTEPSPNSRMTPSVLETAKTECSACQSLVPWERESRAGRSRDHGNASPP